MISRKKPLCQGRGMLCNQKARKLVRESFQGKTTCGRLNKPVERMPSDIRFSEHGWASGRMSCLLDERWGISQAIVEGTPFMQPPLYPTRKPLKHMLQWRLVSQRLSDCNFFRHTLFALVFWCQGGPSTTFITRLCQAMSKAWVSMLSHTRSSPVYKLLR